MPTNNFTLYDQYLSNTANDVCISGGALGSDRKWGELAVQHQHDLLHMSFEGHRYNGHSIEYQVIVPQELLEVADPFLKTASKSLNKGFNPKRPYIANLLRRNYYQIYKSDSLYACTTFNKITGIPEGGTAWAIQMFIDECNVFDECKCYVLCKSTNIWYQFKGTWEKIDNVPEPKGTWAGIGSRDINESNEKAMEALWTQQ